MKFAYLPIVALLIDSSASSLLQKEASCPGNVVVASPAQYTSPVVTAPTVHVPACPSD